MDRQQMLVDLPKAWDVLRTSPVSKLGSILNTRDESSQLAAEEGFTFAGRSQWGRSVSHPHSQKALPQKSLYKEGSTQRHESPYKLQPTTTTSLSRQQGKKNHFPRSTSPPGPRGGAQCSRRSQHNSADERDCIIICFYSIKSATRPTWCWPYPRVLIFF